jgi:hypothetical protein
MGFIRKETYKVPEFCADCPPVEGMTKVEIRRTSNTPPPVDAHFVLGKFADPLIYARDPDNLEAGEVVLGRDYTVDAFCECHEFPESRALSIANVAVDTCTGPVEVKYGFLKRKTKKVCGAGYEKDVLGRVRRLELLGRRQGKTAIDAVNTIIEPTARQF